jgi:hypothetical protein
MPPVTERRRVTEIVSGPTGEAPDQCVVVCDACRAKVIGTAHDSRVSRRLGAARISRSPRQRSMLGRDLRRRLGRRTLSEACHCQMGRRLVRVGQQAAGATR